MDQLGLFKLNKSVIAVKIAVQKVKLSSAERNLCGAFLFPAFLNGSILDVGVKRLFRQNKSTYEDLPLK